MHRFSPKKPPVVIAGLCLALLHTACASTGTGSGEAPATPTVRAAASGKGTRVTADGTNPAAHSRVNA